MAIIHFSAFPRSAVDIRVRLVEASRQQDQLHVSSVAGVATFCRATAVPCRAEEGLSGVLAPVGCTDAVGSRGDVAERLSCEEMKRLDSEGRAIITQHTLKVC